MKSFVALALLSVFLALPLAADACSYGSGASYGAGFSYGYSSYASSYAVPAVSYFAPAVNYFQVIPPTQAIITPAPAAVQVQQTVVAAAPTVTYTYAPPASVTIVQYELPIYAPVQAYYSNYGSYSARSYNAGSRCR